MPTEQQITSLLSDVFAEDIPLGGVVGSVGPRGARRGGVDVEGRIGADNGALRIKPLARPGWGREGVAYGPFQRQPGLVLGLDRGGRCRGVAFRVLAENVPATIEYLRAREQITSDTPSRAKSSAAA